MTYTDRVNMGAPSRFLPLEDSRVNKVNNKANRVNRINKASLALASLALLLTAAARIVSLANYPMDVDEVWSIWQTFGSASEILRWTPYDWPPLHFLIVGGWRTLVGIHPVAVRMASVLAFLVGAACLYRLTLRLRGPDAALLSVLAFGALGFSIHLSLIVRGYIFLVALLPLALWLAMNYFEYSGRGELGRALWALALGLCMAAMFYIHLTSLFAFLMIGLFTLVMYRRAVWRWALPGPVAALLAAPEIVSKASLAVSRVQVTYQIALPPLPQALADLFTDLAGAPVGIWAALFGLASLLLLRALATRREKPVPIAALAIWVLAPIGMYAINPIFGFFSTRYMAWILIGLALWVGSGLALLPRPLRALAGAALVFALSVPIPMRYVIPIPGLSLIDTFPLLAANLKPGDVLLRDPKLRAVPPEVWDYFTLVYFPNGLDFVDAPADHRRIWYISTDGEQDPATREAVQRGRVAGQFFGPWDLLVRLYEAPPDPTGVLFANGMRFHGLDVLNATSPRLPVFREGQTLRLRLWWSADRPVAADYSVSVQLAQSPDAPALAQVDTPSRLVIGPGETSQWQPGTLIVQERDLTLPDPLPPGEYPLRLIVYQWWDGTRIPPQGRLSEALHDFLMINVIYLKSW